MRCLVIALVASALGAPAANACDTRRTSQPAPPRAGTRAPLAIGDSVMLARVGTLTRYGFEVDARACRQWSEGVRVLRARKRAGRLPRVVVVALGSNGSVTAAQVGAAKRIMGPRRRLAVLVPTELNGASSSDASVLRSAPGVRVLDWLARVRRHPGYVGPDGVHLSVAGANAFAALIRTARRPDPQAALVRRL